jgi:hypothetical protein
MLCSKRPLTVNAHHEYWNELDPGDLDHRQAVMTRSLELVQFSVSVDEHLDLVMPSGTAQVLL